MIFHTGDKVRVKAGVKHYNITRPGSEGIVVRVHGTASVEVDFYKVYCPGLGIVCGEGIYPICVDHLEFIEKLKLKIYGIAQFCKTNYK
jgi:hypothetical protein